MNIIAMVLGGGNSQVEVKLIHEKLIRDESRNFTVSIGDHQLSVYKNGMDDCFSVGSVIVGKGEVDVEIGDVDVVGTFSDNTNDIERISSAPSQRVSHVD